MKSFAWYKFSSRKCSYTDYVVQDSIRIQECGCEMKSTIVEQYTNVLSDDSFDGIHCQLISLKCRIYVLGGALCASIADAMKFHGR